MSEESDRQLLMRAAQPPALTLMGELRGGYGTPQFWGSIIRHCIPIFGVFYLHWPAVDIVFYFLLQGWLMGTLYCALDLTFNPKDGQRPNDMLDAAGPLTRNLFSASIAVSIIVGILGSIVLGVCIDEQTRHQFFATGIFQWPFLSGMIGLVTGCLVEAVRFVRSIAHRTPAQIEADDFRITGTLQSLVLMAGFSIVFSVLSMTGVLGRVFVIVAAVVLILFDNAPRSMTLATKGGKARNWRPPPSA